MHRTTTLSCILILLLTFNPDLNEAKACADDLEGDNRDLKALQTNITDTLDKLLEHYDPELRPMLGEAKLTVKVFMNIRSMGPFSDRDKTYLMDFYFRQIWTEPRLKFQAKLSKLSLSSKFLARIWRPDTFFLNGLRSYVHTVPQDNKLLRLNNDGSILYSCRLTVKAKCPMNLQRFPMDQQNCHLDIGSYGYTHEDITYAWKGQHAVKISNDVQLSQFKLIGNHTSHLTSQRIDGNYSIIRATFTLRRHLGHFLINIYFPMMLLVICSWVSFWINREATAERVSLCVTTLLTMAFIIIEHREDLPIVTYTTSLDWFMIYCFAFVFASILEFAYVHFFTKYKTGDMLFRLSAQVQQQDVLATSLCNSAVRTMMNHNTNSVAQNNGKPRYRPINGTNQPTQSNADSLFQQLLFCIKGDRELIERKATSTTDLGTKYNSVSVIDKISRVLFPLAFIVTSYFYWKTFVG